MHRAISESVLLQLEVSPMDPQNCRKTVPSHYRVFSGFPQTQPEVSPAWSLCRQVCLQIVDGWGLKPSIRVSFQDLLGHKQEFLLPGPGAKRLSVDCGLEGSPVTGPFQN